jgi:hypothetical protein
MRCRTSAHPTPTPGRSPPVPAAADRPSGSTRCTTNPTAASSGQIPATYGERMSVDIDAAERFMLANARLLDRHRLAVLLHGAPVAPVLDALRAYRNPDGGFGHALEPDVRAPTSEPAAALHALDVLAGIGALDHPMVSDTAAWIATIADPDGGVPFVLPAASSHPHAPWMVPAAGGSQLTFGLAAGLWEAGSEQPWLERGTEWCWAVLARPDDVAGYLVKFALDFLDSVPDHGRAGPVIAGLRTRIDADGSIPVPGGTADERLTPLTLSQRPDGRSRALFTEDQIETDLDRLESGQQEDGGWTFDWLGWSAGQTVEWRGIVTLRALTTLAAHRRLELPLGLPAATSS